MNEEKPSRAKTLFIVFASICFIFFVEPANQFQQYGFYLIAAIMLSSLFIKSLRIDKNETPLVMKILVLIAGSLILSNHLDNMVYLFFLAVIGVFFIFERKLKPYFTYIFFPLILLMICMICFEIQIDYDFSVSGPNFQIVNWFGFFLMTPIISIAFIAAILKEHISKNGSTKTLPDADVTS